MVFTRIFGIFYSYVSLPEDIVFSLCFLPWDSLCSSRFLRALDAWSWFSWGFFGFRTKKIHGGFPFKTLIAIGAGRTSAKEFV